MLTLEKTILNLGLLKIYSNKMPVSSEINYCIIKINNRKESNILNTKRILKSANFISTIEYFNGIIFDSKQKLLENKIRVRWGHPVEPYSPLPGELGEWVSMINCFKYIVENNLDHMLILEDDAELLDDFLPVFMNAINDLPDNFDFLSLYSSNWDNKKSDTYSDIGSSWIHKAIYQKTATPATLVSNSGAKKILKAVRSFGITEPIDSFLFNKARSFKLIGFSLLPDIIIVKHSNKLSDSMIDPENLRKDTYRIDS